MLLIRRDAKAKTLADARGPNGATILMGSTAEGTSSDVMPVLMRDMLGLNVKAIGGYRDSGVLFLAMERGEVEARGTGLSGVKANKPEWLKPGGLMQRHAGVRAGDPPSRLSRRADRARTRQGGRRPPAHRRARGALQAVAPVCGAARRAGRPCEALQAAFMAAHKDPQYLAEAEEGGIDVSPIDGAEILRLVDRVAEAPKDRLKAIEKFLE